MNGQEKITASHLERAAFIYIRQSTLTQVRDNRGSTERQYEQRSLARELGWADHLIEVIDDDQGKSGTTAKNRDGFQRLVADVAMRKAGAVFGVEVSRLSRSNADWYRLLDLCAGNDTLVIDDGRVHDPSSYDDRLLLGLKGTMADSEIHMMLSRMQGGRYRKALRGEYWSHAPVGYIRAEGDQLLKDSDERVRHAVEQFFKRYADLGSADAVVRDFTERGVKFPLRGRSLEASGHLDWVPLKRGRAMYMLHNPVYAGAFTYGRQRKTKPRWAGSGPWPVILKGRVDPYIRWEEFMKNQKRIQENLSTPTTRGSPRCGQALLQGIAFCGKCGRRMGVAYEGKDGKYIHYQCRVYHEDSLRHVCISVTGKPVDRAVARRVLEVVNRENIEKALQIAREVEKNHGEEEKEWRLRIEAAEYEAQRAFRQYNAVDPENRLVARTLEKAWEEKLLDVERLKEAFRLWETTHPSPLEKSEHRKLLGILEDFQQVWPFAWTLAFVLDQYTRRVLGFTLFPKEPTSRKIREFLGRVSAKCRARPKYIVSDKGPQFTCPAFRAWGRRKGIRPRYASTKDNGHRATAVMERFIRSAKDEWLRRIAIPLRRRAMRQRVAAYILWFHESRPHQGLGGRTPNEVLHGGKPANERARIDPRARWPADSPCAEPKARRSTRKFSRLELVVRFHRGHRQLPIVEIRRVA